jgi:succinyl-diaminopimelate desuccinylase
MSVEKIISEIQASREELAEVCSQLVQRPSDHPEGRTDGCVEYIKEYFDTLGVQSQIYERDEGKPNIVVRIKGLSEQKILWVGHNDVVPAGDPETWALPPYSGTIANGRVWGRGASDMKGSNASAMVAAKVLSQLGSPYDVDFWFTCDEEIGGEAGAKWLAEEQVFEGDVAIVGDSSGCTPGLVNIAVGNKGSMKTTLMTNGKTAHASTPYLGDNAIDKLLQVIPHVRKVADFRLELLEDLKPILDSTINLMLKDETLNEEQRQAVRKLFDYPSGPSLNMINGGVKSNVVPDSATALFDIRLTPGCNAIKVKEHLEALVAESSISGVRVEVRTMPKVGFYEPGESPVVKQLSRAVETVTGVKPVLTVAPWGTDAVLIKRNTTTPKLPEGIPCLLYGPMLRDQLHQPNEYVTIENLVTAAKVYGVFPLYYRKDGCAHECKR